MAYTSSMEIKMMGRSKCVWLNKDWGIRKGDMLYIQAELDGKTYRHTAKAKENSSRYVIIPHFWPCEKGDIIDIKLSYATVPNRPNDDDDDNGGAED